MASNDNIFDLIRGRIVSRNRDGSIYKRIFQ